MHHAPGAGTSPGLSLALTSLPSDLSNLNLDPYKTPPLTTEPLAVSGPYSHSPALDDIPGIAYVLQLDTFLKSQMVELLRCRNAAMTLRSA